MGQTKTTWIQLCKSHVGQVTREHWDAALSILIDKPQSVDKRVAGQVAINLNDPQQPQHVCQQLQLSVETHTYQDTIDVTNIKMQKLISKNANKFADWYRAVIICCDFSVIFIPVMTCDKDDSLAYRLRYKNEECLVETIEGLGNKQKHWLQNTLIISLRKWLQDTITGNNGGSLRLINLEEYTSEYNRLKDKYAGDLISNWTESSDAEKSVHEDIGIAAYLSCLWKGHKVSFVDLGCGNGLLVYLLNSENHAGRGIDLRKRNIWSTFPDKIQACLIEEAIVPGLDTKYPGVDWLLGNHSDELTPWIPVFACLSGPSTNFWVLPCCPFSLTAKYQRKNGKYSVFRDYLNYVTDVGGIAGFQIEEDRMKIPSTKRICLVGQPHQSPHEDRTTKVLHYVATQMANFKPREKVEKVRNCTKIGSDIIDIIVRSVFKVCLQSDNMIERQDGSSWNAGNEVSLADVVAHLQEEKVDLSRLKSECGGLQTLLKNNHSIFCVQKGRVKLRMPSSELPKFDKAKIKRKDCWFHNHHPNGCFLQDSDCTWIHN